MNEELKKALTEIEKDNVTELDAVTSKHHFSRNFDRRAKAVCRGGIISETAQSRFFGFRRLPIWAAVTLLILMCTLVTGCVFAVYHYLTRYIPGFGITDLKSDVSLFAAEESFTVGDMQIETVLYVGDNSGGKLIIWANGPSLGGWAEPLWTEKPIFTVEIGGKSYNALTVNASTGEKNGSYKCEVKDVQFDDDIILVRGEERAAVRLIDQTDMGYMVSSWGEYDGITVKALPLYSNNRIVFIQVEGIADVEHVTASITMYDSSGNKVSSGSGSIEDDGYLAEMPKALPGKIVKIDIDSLRVSFLADDSFVLPIPKNDGAIGTDIKLISNEVFTETLLQIERKGKEVILTTKFDAHKYAPLADVFVAYDSPDAMVGDFNTEGTDVVKYNLLLNDSDTDTITLIPYKYSYIILNNNGPLCSIEIK